MNINSDINLALYEFTNGDKKMAYEKLIAIFENNQNNDQLRFNIAVVEQSLDLNEKAKNNYKFLIEKNKNLKAIINLYLLYIKEENFSEALKYIEILVKTNFISNQIIKDQSFVLFKLKRYK